MMLDLPFIPVTVAVLMLAAMTAESQARRFVLPLVFLLLWDVPLALRSGPMRVGMMIGGLAFLVAMITQVVYERWRPLATCLAIALAIECALSTALVVHAWTPCNPMTMRHNQEASAWTHSMDADVRSLLSRRIESCSTLTAPRATASP
jgi:hypothetical protein